MQMCFVRIFLFGYFCLLVVCHLLSFVETKVRIDRKSVQEAPIFFVYL